ncbi:hypothetical protein KCP73_12355 [Salmonella enterica subsp. enterica]|nr:hypothetical protein KCP73_12355 [Salmonella enterica subsp. enterica]
MPRYLFVFTSYRRKSTTRGNESGRGFPRKPHRPRRGKGNDGIAASYSAPPRYRLRWRRAYAAGKQPCLHQNLVSLLTAKPRPSTEESFSNAAKGADWMFPRRIRPTRKVTMYQSPPPPYLVQRKKNLTGAEVLKFFDWARQKWR